MKPKQKTGKDPSSNTCLRVSWTKKASRLAVAAQQIAAETANAAYYQDARCEENYECSRFYERSSKLGSDSSDVGVKSVSYSEPLCV